MVLVYGVSLFCLLLYNVCCTVQFWCMVFYCFAFYCIMYAVRYGVGVWCMVYVVLFCLLLYNICCTVLYCVGVWCCIVLPSTVCCGVYTLDEFVVFAALSLIKNSPPPIKNEGKTKKKHKNGEKIKLNSSEHKMYIKNKRNRMEFFEENLGSTATVYPLFILGVSVFEIVGESSSSLLVALVLMRTIRLRRNAYILYMVWYGTERISTAEKCSVKPRLAFSLTRICDDLKHGALQEYNRRTRALKGASAKGRKPGAENGEGIEDIACAT